MEPLERSEEITSHPADLTHETISIRVDQLTAELRSKRHELSKLLDQEGSQQQIEILKGQILEKHDALMETLKNEQRINKNKK